MSKTVPVHARSSRPSSPVSPASALLPASRRLTASPVALPVHDVSTTRATTQKLPSARADWPEVRPGGCNLPITLPSRQAFRSPWRRTLASFQHPPGAEASSCIASLDRIVRTRRPGCSADDQGRVEDDFPGIGSPLVEALDDGLDGMFGHLRGVLPDGGEIDEG